MTSKLLTTLTGGLLAFGLLVLWQNREVTVAEAVHAPPITQGDPAALRQLVSILSPTCSHCADHEAQSGTLLGEAATDGRLYYAVYPVTTTRGAEGYTYAFLCAAKQGAFGAYARAHYRAYFGQEERPDAAVTARDAGLDVTAFERCLSSPEVVAEAAQSLAWAKQLGAAATPTFFIYLPENERWQRLQGQKRCSYWEKWLWHGG